MSLIDETAAHHDQPAMPAGELSRPVGDLSRRALMLGIGSLGLAPVIGAGAAAPAQAAPSAVHQRLTARLTPLLKPHDMAVSIKDWGSGKTWNHRGGRSYNLASVVKVITAISLARYARARGRAMSSTERGHLTQALRVSSNTSQSWMWNRVGGWKAYDATCRALGLSSGSKPYYNWGWGRAWSTSNDLLKVMNYLLSPQSSVLHTTDAIFIRDQMARSAAGQIWGVGAMGRGSGRTVRVKNGWVVLSSDNTWRINSIGHVYEASKGLSYTATILSRGWKSMSTGTNHANKVGKDIYRILQVGNL